MVKYNFKMKTLNLKVIYKSYKYGSQEGKGWGFLKKQQEWFAQNKSIAMFKSELLEFLLRQKRIKIY